MNELGIKVPHCTLQEWYNAWKTKKRLPRKIKKTLKYLFLCGFFTYDPEYGFIIEGDNHPDFRQLEDQEEYLKLTGWI